MKIKGDINNPKDLGEILQQGRLLSGLTQQEMADKMGISQAYIWQIESGLSTKYAERLFELLRASGIRLQAEIETESTALGKSKREK